MVLLEGLPRRLRPLNSVRDSQAPRSVIIIPLRSAIATIRGSGIKNYKMADSIDAHSRLVHVLGGGQWQVYTVRLAKELGYRVLVTDMYKDRPAYSLADVHEVVDITDMDATLKIAERYGIDAIVCDTTDVGVPTMAYVAEKLGLPGIGYDTALNFTDKVRMRVATSAAGVPNPPFQCCSSRTDLHRAARDIGFPLVVKPSNSQSSRGVRTVRKTDELDEVFAEASRFARGSGLIAEGYLDGIEITVESVVIDGEVHVVGVSDKEHFAHCKQVAKRLTYPADLSGPVNERIRDVNAQVIRSLGLRTGISHAEYMLVDSEPFLVEIAARGGGSHVYSHIVPYLAGIPVTRHYLEFLLGGSFSARPDNKPRAANLAFFDFPAGRVKSIRGVAEARALQGTEILLLEFKEGDTMALPSDDRSRPGQVVVLGESRDQVLDRTRQVFELVKVTVS